MGNSRKDNYPAALDKVKGSLIGLAELRFREPKTKNPDLHAKLGLQDYKEEGSTSTLVRIQTQDNQEAGQTIDWRPTACKRESQSQRDLCPKA